MIHKPLFDGVPVKNKKVAREERVQLQVCRYLKMQYPSVLFMCDIAAGLHLGVKWAGITKASRARRGMPDIYIFMCKKLPYGDPGSIEMTYYGLAIELKSGKTSIYKKDGSLRSKKTVRRTKKKVEQFDHLQEQQEALQLLRAQGWKAEFAQGFDEAKKIIDEYLSG